MTDTGCFDANDLQEIAAMFSRMGMSDNDCAAILTAGFNAGRDAMAHGIRCIGEADLHDDAMRERALVAMIVAICAASARYSEQVMAMLKPEGSA